MSKKTILTFCMAMLGMLVLFVPAYAANDILDFRTLYPYDTVGNGYNPEERMAHNFYFDPDLSACSGEYSAFSIDFKADLAPNNTYWSLCNWTMKGGEGAYAGFQKTSNGNKVGIISFWENAGVNAQRIYPDNYSHEFDGEGEGTNSIVDYNWQNGKWYRMVLRCYDSNDYNGDTIVEQWVQDKETGVWTLLSAFDTKLKGSCMTGSMSIFMENFYYENCEDIRTIQIKNIYVQECGSSKWKSITKGDISVDTWWDNKKGGYTFGSTNDYVWGITCGVGEDFVTAKPSVPTSLYCGIPATDSAPDYDFVWPELRTEKITAGEYYIKSRLDTSFRAFSNSTNLVLTDSKNSADGVYVFELTNDGYYKIKNKANGRYLSSTSTLTQQEGTGDHYKVILSGTCSSDYQKWIIQKNTDGYYLIKNKAKLMYLDVQDASAYNGNNINLFDRNDLYYAQDWELKLIKATEVAKPSAQPTATPTPKPTATPSVTNAGWKKTSGGWKYQNFDGTYVKSAWKSIGGKWYHFNANGYMQTGWIKSGGKWYYLDKSSGAMAISKWISGIYYVKSNGVMATNEWISGKYYVGADGKWDKTKQIVTAGWKKSNGKWWYQNADGTYPKSQWQKISGKWYHFDSKGYMQTGWIKISGKYYYLDKTSGAMATSKWISGIYFVKSNGVMATNEWISNKYYVGADGKWIKNKIK